MSDTGEADPKPFGFAVTWHPDATRDELPAPPIAPWLGSSAADRARALLIHADAVEEHARAVARTVHEPAHWTVALPHQCSEWVIADGDLDQAVGELRRFIAEAEQALHDLVQGRERDG